ncbi:MAG: tetratricopeptide repeat protein [Planctomycetota bacterium]|jgi:hypothetical protein
MVIVLAVVTQLAGCRSQPSRAAPQPTAKLDTAVPARRIPEATSLLGRPLYPSPLDRAALITRGLDLADAQVAFREDPLAEQNIIWFGRRLAYIGRYRQAIAVYSDGIILHPGSYKLLRHRGHRYITTRRLDDAIDDLSRAAALIEDVPDEPEPDGLPNARNIPTSTSHTNIYYHLGLAHYLKGEFAPALEAYRRCLAFAANDDMTCATVYWLYLTLRRLGSDDEAATVLEPVHADMDIIENFAYHRLLLLYKGELTLQQVLQGAGDPGPVGVAVDEATLAYGLGAWHLLNGDLDQAYAVFHEIVEDRAWPAFGHIAAEAEIGRWMVRADSEQPPIGGSSVPIEPAASGSP